MRFSWREKKRWIGIHSVNSSYLRNDCAQWYTLSPRRPVVNRNTVSEKKQKDDLVCAYCLSMCLKFERFSSPILVHTLSSSILKEQFRHTIVHVGMGHNSRHHRLSSPFLLPCTI